MNRLANALARLAIMAVIFVVTLFGVGELVIRGLRVEPRVVMVREQPGAVRISTLSGRVVWEEVPWHEPGAETRQNLPCDDQAAHRVHLYGDSIAFGSELSIAESPGQQLRDALARRQPGAPWCVQNLAQPGATPYVARAFADAHLPTSRPALVILELWYGGNHVPLRAGDVVYYPTGMLTDADHYPTFAFGWTGAWHHALFDRSRFWAWSTFAVNPRCDACEPTWDDLLNGDVAAIVDGARAVGAEPVLWVAAPLDVPFAQTRAQPPDWTASIDAWAAARRVRVVHTADLLADEPVEAVRLDPCCHLNADGARDVAAGLVEQLGPVVDEIAARTPGPATVARP
jgi:hypothetical protein